MSNIISFVSVAMVLFMIIKAINTSKKREVVALAPFLGPTNEEKLLTEIRDLLKK